MKIIDERNMKKKKDRKEQRSGAGYSEKVGAKGFLQLIGKDSLIFQSNLELALSVILKERELYESKHVAVECRCLKI